MRLFYLIILYAGLVYIAAQEMTSNGNVRTDPRTLVATANEQVLRGADLYFENCSVCHGDTGLGLEEAKTAFPEEDRDCTRCHRPGNPKTVNWLTIQDNNMFDIGKPGILRSETALTAFPTAAALYAYIRATMPRYEPGRLNDSDYLAVTAFLAHINGADLAESSLNKENSVHVRLRD